MFSGRLLPIALAASLLMGALPARAEDDEQRGATPPRLSYLDGEVSFWRPGAEDWAPAHVNTPLAEGDSVYTGSSANVELQIGSRAFVRAGENTELGVDGLEPEFLQLKVTSGHVALDLRSLPRGQRIEVDTPKAAITIDDAGYYRVIVGEAGTRLITRRGGRATVTPEGGEQTLVPEGTEAAIEGGGPVQTQAAPDLDAWDHWNYERGERRVQPARRYVPEDVYGADDLDQYGSWRSEPTYGEVWYPQTVAAGWAPYSTGRWLWDPFYGWSWCDDAPWGWAPFHYGRWVSVNGFWGWAPGSILTTAVYAPALVAFFGPVSVSVGLPFVSWVSLGWGEPCLPWWGVHVGQPWWGGWGGPHVHITNVTNINVYRNVHVRNSVISVQREGFGRGRAEHVHLDQRQIRELRPVRGRLDVKPEPASLVASEGRGRRPPDAIRNRAVVSTREPRDPSTRLRAEGLPAPTESGARPRRIVEAPTRQHARPSEPVRAHGFESPGGGAASEPPRHDRMPTPSANGPREHGWRGAHPDRPQPPAPPRHEQGEGSPQGVGRAAEPPRHYDVPSAHVAPEPRQSPRMHEPAHQPLPPGWSSGQRPAPPPQGSAPQRHHPNRGAIPQYEAPSGQPVPVVPQQQVPAPGGGAPNAAPHRHNDHATPEPHPQRFAPPAPPRTTYRTQPTPRTAWAPRQFTARQRPRFERPPVEARSAPARSFERPAPSRWGRASESGRLQGRRHGVRS